MNSVELDLLGISEKSDLSDDYDGVSHLPGGNGSADVDRGIVLLTVTALFCCEGAVERALKTYDYSTGGSESRKYSGATCSHSHTPFSER